MITPKYAVKIENDKKQASATAYTDDPWFASVLVTGIMSSPVFKDIVSKGGRIVAEATAGKQEYGDKIPDADAYANGDIDTNEYSYEDGNYYTP